MLSLNQFFSATVMNRNCHSISMIFYTLYFFQICDICQKEFSYKTTFQRHQRKHANSTMKQAASTEAQPENHVGEMILRESPRQPKIVDEDVINVSTYFQSIGFMKKAPWLVERAIKPLHLLKKAASQSSKSHSHHPHHHHYSAENSPLENGWKGKICTQCRKYLPLNSFYGGTKSICSQCEQSTHSKQKGRGFSNNDNDDDDDEENNASSRNMSSSPLPSSPFPYPTSASSRPTHLPSTSSSPITFDPSVKLSKGLNGAFLLHQIHPDEDAYDNNIFFQDEIRKLGIFSRGR